MSASSEGEVNEVCLSDYDLCVLRSIRYLLLSSNPSKQT
jgi:hypothetical protein